MPSRAKRAVSERHSTNHSHSQGLAAPGRRVSKVQASSSSDLNSNNDFAFDGAHVNIPDGRARSLSSAAAATDIQGLEPGLESPDIFDQLADEAADALAIMGSTQSHHTSHRRRATSTSSANDIEAHGIENQVADHATPNMSLVSGHACRKTAQSKSKLVSAATILSVCPLWDVLAMLTVLLQFNPLVISVLHGVFAVLTFVSPSASFSIGNLPSLQDLMAVDPAGAPSMQTVLLVDVLLMLCFVWLAVPAQNVLLELSQAVIAISLGGAAASQGRTTSSLVCCAVIIAFSHLTNWKLARQFSFSLLSSAFSLDLPAEAAQSSSPSYYSRLHASPGKVRSILGAHILAQGILKGARRYISSSKHPPDMQSVLKKNDGDGSNGSAVNSPRIGSNVSDALTETALITTGDGRPPGQPPNNATKDKVMNTKKKSKRQANQIRVQQPLWAALATTKVSVTKEYEQAKPSSDAREARAAGLSKLGDVDFAQRSNRVWIVDVGAVDLTLGLCLPHESKDDSDNDLQHRQWHVKVNGASWHSIKARLVQTFELHDETLDLWEARIYGLSPLSTYHCEVLKNKGDDVMYDTNFLTQPAPSREAAATIMPSVVPVLQPSSPTATLRSSVRTIEAETEKSRNALKSARKQHKTVLERLQSQIDREKAKLSSTGGSDERQRQRQKQLENSIAKAKSESDDLRQRLDELGEVPKSDRQKYSKAKDEAKARQKKMDAKRAASDKAKRDSDRLVAAAKSDIDTLLHKRTRFEGSQKEYVFKLSEASKKADQAAYAKSQRIARQLQSAAERRQFLMQWENYEHELERSITAELSGRETILREIEQYQEWYQSLANNPDLPEGFGLGVSSGFGVSSGAGSSSLPGSRPHSLHISNSGFSPSLPYPQQSSTLNPNSLRGTHGHRRRASSLEANSLSDPQPAGSSHSSAQSPFGHSNFAVPPGFRFAPTSSSALLANSTALSPSHAPSMLPAISPLANLSAIGGFVPKTAQSPVGVVGGGKKDSRRKNSAESGKSPRAAGSGGHADNDNDSPKMVVSGGNGVIGSGLRNGMVSPPSSANWDANLSR